MLYKFKLGHNATEATKNICSAKGEGTVDHSTVNRWLEKFCLSCKNPNNQVRSSKHKLDSKTALSNRGKFGE